MFGRDPIMPVAKLLEPKLRYYGEQEGALKMDMLKKVVHNSGTKYSQG